MKAFKTLITKTFIIATVVCLALLGTAKAQNIDLATAKQVGAFYFNAATGTKAPVDADKLELAQQLDNPTLSIPALYAFNVPGNGFVVVSASDCVEPVLAYSPTGDLNPETVNPACRYMLESYADLISECQNQQVTATAEVREQWAELMDGTFTCDPTKGAVLVKAKWGQGDPDKPTYNILCPRIGGRPCIAGCVATATAMIVHFWKYPEKGKGTATVAWNGSTIRYKFSTDSNKFVYDSMPNTVSITSPWDERHAVSKLSFACGVITKMHWGLDGSGTQSTYVPEGLSTYMKYDPEVTYLSRSGVSDANWINILHSEIDDFGRPVYYSGRDPDTTHGRDAAGHAFVIAGTAAADTKKFYINWGWDGGSNGFFTLAPASSIQAAGSYRFTAAHAMVYKIHPLGTTPVSIEDCKATAVTPAYPNPASEYLMIPSNHETNMLLQVYSVDGKLVEKTTIPAYTKEYRLDLQGYAPGTYLYRLNGDTYKFTVR